MRAGAWFGAVAAAVVAVSAVGTALAAQGSDDAWLERCRKDNERGGQVRYCEVRELGMRATGRAISVDGRENGGISVAGWDRDSIAVRALVQTWSGSESEARDLAREVRVTTSGEAIRADGPPGRRGASWSVSYEIKAPRRSDLRLDTYNGPIDVERVSGRMELSAHNGPLALSAVGGDVHGRTINGPLVVKLDGARWEGAGLDVETTNGPVVLQLPEQYSAHLETGTENGPVNIGFPITVRGRIDKRIATDLGSGGPTVRAVTTNGPLTISRH
jgi:hypothetical protein